MWHTKSFIFGAMLGLFLWGCGSGKFAAHSQNSQLFYVEVDDPSTSTVKDSLDAVDAGSSAEAHDKHDISESSKIKADKAHCASSLETQAELIRVTGSQQNMTLASSSSILSRITGNLNELTLNLHSKSLTAKVSGLCLFIAGHENQALINIQVPLDTLEIKARGDQAVVRIVLEKGGKIGKINWDAKGNQPQLIIQGAAETYPCPQSVGKAQVKCQ